MQKGDSFFADNTIFYKTNLIYYFPVLFILFW